VNLLHLIRTYGCLALFIGTFFEGETALLVGGVAAAQGFLDLRWMMISAFLGSVAGDQLFFLIGRYKSEWFLARSPGRRQRLQKVLNAVERQSYWMVFFFRFMYGLRNLSSFAIGMTRMPIWAYVPLNCAAAAIWVVGFGLVGRFFGSALLPVLVEVKCYKLIALGLMCIAALMFWLFRKRRSGRAIQRNAVSRAPEEPRKLREDSGLNFAQRVTKLSWQSLREETQ